MALTILHDQEKRIAVYFCTTSDEPVSLPAFQGFDASEQAEDFCNYLGKIYGQDDVRAYENKVLREYLEEWREIAFSDEDDSFTPVADSVSA